MKRKDMFIGLLFIFAAAFIILNQFGIFNGIEFFHDISIFDIIVTIVLAGIFIKSLLNMNFWGIFFSAAFVCIIFDNQLNITKFTPWPALLTALFLSIGFSLIFSRPRHWVFSCNHSNCFGTDTINQQDSNVIYCSATFGDCIKYVNSPNFEKADVRSTFGDVSVYFDKALIPSGKADIYLNVAFGDVDLYIPRTWKVINNTNNFFGDLSFSGQNYDSVSPVVTLHGNISFGDVDINFVD
jgi:predicted membrane protein